ncbi:MAG: aspartate aminotransferase family protein [Candidatus Riflebacteria bacterium]|nr:aspartate aminotransferase family protein [Candidatus Riflebacteria bacterium]
MSEYMSTKEIAEHREKYLMPAYMSYYQEPLHLVRGEMQYLYDDKGKRYLDAFAAVVTISVGHCHPDVVPGVQQQYATLQHATTLYHGEALVKLAKKLSEIAPGKLQKSFFTNSGTEATEFAAVIAKNHTKRHEFLSLRHSFHGRTLMSMTLGGQSLWRHSVPYAFGVTHIPAAYCYRCPLGLAYPSCDIRCAHEVEEAVKYSTSGKIAGLIAEPIQGFGGVITPPKEYFKIVAELVRKHGGLFIVDEVQTGFGRTGGKWFGIEQWGVEPDIMTMAKGMGNGIPIGGVITTSEIAEAHRGLIHFSTFGGNPVSTTQARLVIETVEKRGYLEHIEKMGDHLKKRLVELSEKHRMIGEVRGMGLMLGVELVRDRKTKEPAKDETLRMMELCKERGVLIGKGAMAGNVIRIKPPYCLTKDDADAIVTAIDEGLTILEKKK